MKLLAPMFQTARQILGAACLLAPVLGAMAAPAHAEGVTPRRLLEVVDVGPPVVSPDGRFVAYRTEQASVERNTYDTVWYVQDLGGQRAPRRIADGGAAMRTDAGGPLAVSAVWSPDMRWIYYRALADSRVDVWRAAVDGSGAEPLTRDPADVSDFWLSEDGASLVYSVGATREEILAAEQAEYDRGIRIDGTVPIGQNLFRSGHVHGRLATQRYTGLWFVRAGLLAETVPRLRAIDLASGEQRDDASSDRVPGPRLAAEGLPDAWRSVADPGTERVAMLTRSVDAARFPTVSTIGLLMRPARGAGQPIRCRAEACVDKAITSVQWRPHSDEILFTVTDPSAGLAQSIFRWDVRTGAVTPVANATGLINGGRDPYSLCGVSAEALVCVAAEADQPPRIERIDIDTGRRETLHAPNAALAHDLSIAARSRLVRWTSESGQAFSGHFFPATRSSGVLPPLFVHYYSCAGFLRGGVGDEWPLASLAARGISALCIQQVGDFTGDRVQLYDLGLSAIERVVDRLAAEGEIDRARVGMGGLSFGTEMTMWTAMQSDLLAAASVTSTVVTPTYYLMNSLMGDGFFDELRSSWGLGHPDETPERWGALSPAYNLHRIQAPILMQMPEQEYLRALDYAVPLVRSHRADLYAFPQSPHVKFQPRHLLAASDRNLDWFRFWLLDQETPDPARRLQYEHWRIMRDHLCSHAVDAQAADKRDVLPHYCSSERQ